VIDDDLSGASSGDSNGRVDPGESIEMPVTVVNWTDETLCGVQATLRNQNPSDLYIEIMDSVVRYGDIDGFASASSPDAYEFTAALSCSSGHVIEFELIATDDQNSTWVSEFNVPVGGCEYVEHCQADVYVYSRWQWGGPNQYTEEFTLGVYDGDGGAFPVIPPRDRVWFIMDVKGVIYDLPKGDRPAVYYRGLVAEFDTSTCEMVDSFTISDSWDGNRGLAFEDPHGTSFASLWYTKWAVDTVFNVNFSGEIIGAYPAHHHITGLAFDSDNEHLWGIISGNPDMFIEYDVSDGAAIIQAPFPVPRSDGQGCSGCAAGLDYCEEEGVLIAVNQTTDHIVYFRDIEPGFSGMPAPRQPGVELLDSCAACGTRSPTGIAMLRGSSTQFVTGNPLHRPLPMDKYLLSVHLGCCIPPIRGNVDYDPEDMVDVSDMVYLVDYMFQAGPPPECIPEANIDGSCCASPPEESTLDIDISDLVCLVEYMFVSPDTCFPAPCPGN